MELVYSVEKKREALVLHSYKAVEVPGLDQLEAPYCERCANIALIDSSDSQRKLAQIILATDICSIVEIRTLKLVIFWMNSQTVQAWTNDAFIS